MLLPEFMYGTMKEVKSNCLKISRKLNKGIIWEEAINANMVDTASNSGFIILYPQGSGTFYNETHFYVYLLLNQISDARLPNEIREVIYHKCIESPWGVLSLIAGANNSWLYNEKRHASFLKATLKYWDLFINEGDRYFLMDSKNNTLWAVGSSLLYVLANMGVPTEVLKKPLPDGNLKALIDKYNLL